MLYKYMSSRRCSFFENYKLRLTQPFILNDIEEGKLNFVYDPDEQVQEFLNRNIDKIKESDRAEEMMQQVKQGLLQKKMKEDPDYLVDIAIRATKKIVDETLGVLSLTQNPLNTTMWAYYADTYTGFVLGLDESNSFFKPIDDELIGCGILKKMDYTDVIPDVDLSMRNLPTNFLFEKRLKWDHEEEVRMLRMLKSADEKKDEIYLYRVPKQAIAEIYIGHGMDKKVKQKVLTSIKDTKEMDHVKVYSVQVSGFKLKTTTINY